VGGEAAKSCSACETSTETTKVVSPPTFYFSIGAGLPPLFPLLSGGDEGGVENVRKNRSRGGIEKLRRFR